MLAGGTLKDEGTSPDLDEDLEEDLEEDLDEDENAGRKRSRIRCPLCMWVPRASDRWTCYCGCPWHTFDTAGRCPDCGFQHEHTVCLACHRWSQHLAWYTEGDAS
jgi:hypothetical protein